MKNDKVIIDYAKHKELLEKEELWDKYKREHTYSGLITAIVCNYRNAREYLEHLEHLEYPVDRISSSFSPNTPEEVKEMLTEQVERLEAKLEGFKEECISERMALDLEIKESLDKIPNWIRRIFI